ncbi:hypothetical protein ABE099_03030 [Paenibacillus turicensis]|uniref:hypothetical protein n=1 Tax=Paenibacillus turicensis TaxID=160487 RepID=UPI003D2C7DBA
MIYHLFFINQVLIALVICPIIALTIGFLMSKFNKSKKVAFVISFLLPLIYTTYDLPTFKANIGAWFLWGLMYVGFAFIGDKLATNLFSRNR